MGRLCAGMVHVVGFGVRPGGPGGRERAAGGRWTGLRTRLRYRSLRFGAFAWFWGGGAGGVQAHRVGEP